MTSAELHLVERSFEFTARVVRLCSFLETQDFSVLNNLSSRRLRQVYQGLTKFVKPW